MNITSTKFENGGAIPSRYTCDGENLRPPLSFGDVPRDARALAIIVDDPDSPTGTWNHWTAWNIDPKRAGIGEGETGGWVEGMTTFGDIGYGGPCPHKGAHRYIFTLYALDTTLDLPRGTTKKSLLKAMEGHILETAELIGVYERA